MEIRLDALFNNSYYSSFCCSCRGTFRGPFRALIASTLVISLLFAVRSMMQLPDSISTQQAAYHKADQSEFQPKPAKNQQGFSSSTKLSSVDTVTKRWNVIILTHMSSGSTFTGNIFNFHPDVFYLYEPLHNLRRKVYGDEWNRFDNATNQAYTKDFFNLFRDILTCQFQEENTLSRTFPPFVRSNKHLTYWRYSTPELTKEVVGNACKGKKVTVAKVMQTRLPREIGIQELERVCRADPKQFDCLIIHLVRDPRAVVSSLLRRKFFVMGPKGKIFNSETLSAEGLRLVKHNAQLLCSQVANNLNYVRKNWSRWFQGRYKLVRYEDIAGNALDTANEIYSFVGLSMAKSIYEWIVEGKKPSEIKKGSGPFTISEDDTSRIYHWRSDRDPSFISLFEEACAPLMKEMGYILLNGSKDLQYDLNKPLMNKDIPFLKDLPF